MKKICTILSIILISFSGFSQNKNIEEQLKKANDLYAQNKFEDAVKQYEKIISENYASPELYFNTANTYYRLNEIGKAIYWYEKAKILSPNDKDIKYNLDLAKLRVKNLPPEVPKIFPVRIFLQVTSFKSAEFWGYLSLFLFILFLGILYFYFTAATSKTKKIRFLIAVFILLFSIVSLIFMQYNLSKLNAHNQAIVISNEVIAKSSPDTNATDLFKIYEGYKVKIETKNGNWYEIKLTDGKKAWILKDNLMIL